MTRLSLSFIFFSLFIKAVVGIDHEAVFEKALPEPYEVAPNILAKWQYEVPYWYTPMSNKYAVFKALRCVYGAEESQKLSESAADDLCPYFVTKHETKIDEYHLRTQNRSRTISLKRYNSALRRGRYDWTVLYQNGTETDYMGSVRWVLTNNHNYTVAVQSYKSGGVGFIVYSSQPKLEGEDETVIRNKLKSLGFKEEHFYKYDYEGKCLHLKEELAAIEERHRALSAVSARDRRVRG